MFFYVVLSQLQFLGVKTLICITSSLGSSYKRTFPTTVNSGLSRLS